MRQPKTEEAAKRYFVCGRVQGVGYRYFVVRAAQQLGLCGYARNLEDGRVEVLAVGPPGKLSELCSLLWKGPRWADVRTVEEHESSLEHHHGFHIRG